MEWAQNPTLHVDLQDEHIILAEAGYLDILLNLLDNHRLAEGNRETIIETLCVLLYDNTLQEDSDVTEVDNDLADKVRSELFKRKQTVVEYKDYFFSYLKEVVFPQLGLSPE